ncbi:MAG TPA: lipopolysaccharide biosynthesis protein [Acidimicrobiales bacterium]
MSDAATSRGLNARLRRGAAWSTLDVAVGRLGQFAMGVVVARLLIPQDFGVFAVALVVHAIVINMSELGVSAALVRDDVDDVNRSAPTVATIALATSVVLAALMAVSASTLARLLGSPSASGAIAVMALTLPLAGVTAVPAALLRRDFRMDRLFVANAANTVATALVVIPLALAGWGAMALAWSWVAGQLATTVLLLTYRAGRFWPGWNRLEARRLITFGLPLAGANIVNFSVLNVDFIVVGRVLGATALGFYVLAFNISGWPMNVIGAVVRSVSLPGFAQLRRDGEAMPEHFLSALRVVAGISLPICLILGALARPAILTIYGDKWSAAAAALVGLSVLGATRILLELMADFLVSLGRTRAVFLAQLPWLVGLTIALLIAVRQHGIAGAGVAQAVVAVGLMTPIYLWFLNRAGVRPASVAGSLWSPLLWALLAAAVAGVVAGSFSVPFVGCLVGGTAGLVVYLIPNAATIRGVVAEIRRTRAQGQDGPASDEDLVTPGVALVGELP